MSLSHKIEELRRAFHEELKSAASAKDLEAIKVKYLGRKGPIQALMVDLKNVSSDERPHLGKAINDLKSRRSRFSLKQLGRVTDREMQERVATEAIDPTLPGRRQYLGRAHPITQTIERACDVLIGMGFSVRLGPEVDTDYYNFEALNFPPEHPARDMQDTFYLTRRGCSARTRATCKSTRWRSLRLRSASLRRGEFSQRDGICALACHFPSD